MRLELVDRLAEGDPLLGVVVGVVGRALGDADRLRGGAEARALERRQRDRQPLALRRRSGSPPGTRTSSKTGEPVGEPLMPSLCSSLPIEKPGRSASTTKAVSAPVLAVGHGEDDVEVGDAGVGDPVLGAVDDPLVAVAHARSCASPPGSEPASGSRQREGGRPLAAWRTAAGSAPSARRSRRAGSAACRAPGPSGSARSRRTPWRSPRPRSGASACRCRCRRTRSANGSPRMSCSANSLRMSHGYSPVASISAARGRDPLATIWRIVSRKSLCSCGRS